MMLRVYDDDQIAKRIKPGKTFRKRLSVEASFGRYDLPFYVDVDPSLLCRLAGHIENGGPA